MMIDASKILDFSSDEGILRTERESVEKIGFYLSCNHISTAV